MGAWPYVAMQLPSLISRRIVAVTRPASSASATGSAKAHAAEHEEVVAAALRVSAES
jgi:multifunctional 2-oxoglutarate metabolism enzyme